MAEKKVGPSDFKAEAERLVQSGKMPPLHDLLDAVASARAKYADKIVKARETGPEEK